MRTSRGPKLSEGPRESSPKPEISPDLAHYFSKRANLTIYLSGPPGPLQELSCTYVVRGARSHGFSSPDPSPRVVENGEMTSADKG